MDFKTDQELRQEALKCFKFYDVEKTEKIKIDKLEKLMASLGYQLKKQEYQEILKISQESDETFFNFGQFFDFIKRSKKIEFSEENLKDIFELLDYDEDGTISFQDFLTNFSILTEQQFDAKNNEEILIEFQKLLPMNESKFLKNFNLKNTQ